MRQDRDLYDDLNRELNARIRTGNFHVDHRCVHCGEKFENHAGPKNPDCPHNRCPGNVFPSLNGDSNTVDIALRDYWNERSTVFSPK